MLSLISKAPKKAQEGRIGSTLGVSPYLHLRRDGQSPHLHGQPRLADLDELVEAERLLEVLPRRVRLPLLLGCQRRRLQHSHTQGSQGSQ